MKKHLDKIEELQLEKQMIMNELASKIENNEKVDSKKYRKRLEEIEQQMLDERKKFYNSLDDLLTNEQIAKFIVFQSKFRREIMRQMMRQNRSRMPNN